MTISFLAFIRKLTCKQSPEGVGGPVPLPGAAWPGRAAFRAPAGVKPRRKKAARCPGERPSRCDAWLYCAGSGELASEVVDQAYCANQPGSRCSLVENTDFHSA